MRALLIGLLGLVLGAALLGGAVAASVPDPDRAGPPTPAAPVPAPVPTPAPGLPDQPNLVVVMADDMRADDLLFAPAVRRLVDDRGVRFSNAFAPYPLCCPARASFLTGQHAHHHGVLWHEPPYGYASFDDSRTLATAARAAGYRTGFVGKYLNRYGLDTSRVSGQPSDTYVPAGWDHWRAAVEAPPGASYDGSTYDYLDTPFNVDGRVEDRWEGRYQTDVVGDLSVDLAARLAGDDRPFLMYVNFLAPHFGAPVEADDPVGVTADDGERHDFRTPAVPADLRGHYDDLVDRGRGLPRDGGPAEGRIDDKPELFARLPEPNAAERDALRELTRQRAESILALDRQVARLVAELRRSGAWDDTVLVFTSDNGYYLGEHRRRSGKVQAHEPSLRIPLLMTGPGIRDGRTVDDPVTILDLTATLLDLAGAEPPRTPDGRSVLAAVTGPGQGWTRPVLTEAAHGPAERRRTPGFRDSARTSIGVRTGRYSYVRHRTGETELYDLWHDPAQLRNVAGTPAYRSDEELLGRVWWRLRNCAGAVCQQLLPPPLRVGPEELAARTSGWWAAMERTYGYG
jgi:arylsulfatase A-like enzyme